MPLNSKKYHQEGFQQQDVLLNFFLTVVQVHVSLCAAVHRDVLMKP